MIKCVVWDLDNTLWDGTLDNNDNVQLKDGIKDILEKLYKYGVPSVIASKNNFDFAYEKIKELKIDKYFLKMKISWNHKYKAIEEVAKELNIAVNAILFIDDSEMELFECKTYLPDVNILNAKDYKKTLELIEEGYSMPDDTFNRVEIYKIIQERKEIQKELTRDEFLEKCQIQIDIVEAKETDYDRIIQLSERTNQFNLSCQKYTKDELKKSDYIFICKMKDIFGDYGTVGAMVLNLEDFKSIRVNFFAVSCKVEGRNIGKCMIEKIIEFSKELKKEKIIASFNDNNKNNKLTALFVLYGFVLNNKKDAYVYSTNNSNDTTKLSEKIDEKIIQETKKIIDNMTEKEIDINNNLKECLTSYMFLNLIVELENTFGIEIGLNEVNIQNFNTIKKIAKFINNKLQE